MGDPVLHIQLRDWADILVVAPLSAHSLAKIANGFCDDTLSCVLRAWDFNGKNRVKISQSGDSSHHCNESRNCDLTSNDDTTRERVGKPIIFAPAMNSAMWDHPLTEQQLRTIQLFWNNHELCSTGRKGLTVVEPQIKQLACGEVGIGAMASIDRIVECVRVELRTWNGIASRT
jgi:phosphopantothenoylcysteine decarboxylase